MLLSLTDTFRSRKLLREFLTGHGYNFILGQGYYAFIDVRPWLEKAGWARTSVSRLIPICQSSRMTERLITVSSSLTDTER